MDPLDLLPSELKKQIVDGLIDFLSRQAEKVVGDQVADNIKKLSSEGAFLDAFDKALKKAVDRFTAEYAMIDEDLVAAIKADPDFWKSTAVRRALISLVSHPGSWVEADREMVVQHFEDVLPQRINRERVDKAVITLLRYIAEELWTLPGAKEIREVYRFQMEKISAESLQKQVALQEAQLRATVQLSQDVRQALLELTDALERKALAGPAVPAALPRPRPYHNLPRPDYGKFIGRERELEWLRQRLSPNDRAWQIALTGIGGVGKSALAIAIAREYQQRYLELPEEERFEAIVWISAKEEVLTVQGKEQADLPGLVMHSLDDAYSAIARVLDREDITRASPEDQTRLVQKVLSEQRTLLIMDNLESVTDDRLKPFLRNLPPPTKAIVTSREWVDVADVLLLTGLSQGESLSLISEESRLRNVRIEPKHSQRIIDLTSGLPLPIKLSVARIASGESFAAVARWLGNASGDVPEYCVKGQVDLAIKRDPNAMCLLLACSLFDRTAGALREALGQIADLSNVDRDHGLSQLLKLCLVNRSESDRFWMLPIVQRYAAAQLPLFEDYEQLFERWLGWLLSIAQTAGVSLEAHIESIEILNREYLNLLIAIEWCREHGRWERVIRLVEGAWFYPYLMGQLSNTRDLLNLAGLAARELGDERKLGKIEGLLGRVEIAYDQNVDEALAHLETAETLARRFQDNEQLGWAWTNRCAALLVLGETEEAERLAHGARRLGAQENHARLKSTGAMRLSECEAKKRNYAEALRWLDRAEEDISGEGLSRHQSWITSLRGYYLLRQGRPAEAIPHLAKVLETRSVWGDRRGEAHSKHHLALAYAALGQAAIAKQYAIEAQDLYERLGITSEVIKTDALLRNLTQV